MVLPVPGVAPSGADDDASRYGSSQNGICAGKPSGGNPSLDSLDSLAAAGLAVQHPTPRASDRKRSTISGSNWSDTLSGSLSRTIPTPTAMDRRSSRRAGYMGPASSYGDFALDPLGSESTRGATARSLNPQFCEWLMGWPINWTCSCGRCPIVTGDEVEIPDDCCLVRHRNERLWICGNGVVPQVAAAAFRHLAALL